MSSSSSSSDLELKLSLEVDPHVNFQPWLDELASLATAQCADYSERGALHLACTDELWASLPEHANQVPPRPVYPRPGPLDPQANPAQRLIYEDAKAAHAAHTIAAAKLKKAVIGSIGEANALLIADPIHGMLLHSAQSIINSLLPIFGTYTEDAISAFESKLQQKLVSIDTFDQHVGTFRTNLAQLSRSGQALLPFRAYTIFTSTLSNYPHFQTHITSFVTANPDLAARTFPALSAHLRLHLPTIRAASAGNAFAGGALLSPPPPDHKALLAKVSSLERKLAALSATPPPSTHSATPPSSGTGPRTSLTTPRGYFYCFVHGHNLSHGWSKKQGAWQFHGTKCSVIAKNPANYTPEQEAAKTPTEVSGGNQRVQRKVPPTPPPNSPPSSPQLPPPSHPAPRKHDYANPFACLDAVPPPILPPSFPRDAQSRPITTPLPFSPTASQPSYAKPPPATTPTGTAIFGSTGAPEPSWDSPSFASLHSFTSLPPSALTCLSPVVLPPPAHMTTMCRRPNYRTVMKHIDPMRRAVR